MEQIAIFVHHIERESLLVRCQNREASLTAAIYGALGLPYTSRLCTRGIYHIVDVAVLVAQVLEVVQDEMADVYITRLQNAGFQVVRKTMASDVTVNPIPSNYGLITWDGSVLTVS